MRHAAELRATFSEAVDLINKGSADDVYKGQAIIDAQGVMGQTYFVNALSSTVMLITDASHALPVQSPWKWLRNAGLLSANRQKFNLLFAAARPR